MSNLAVLKTEGSLQLTEGELIKVLQSSLYPGAALESIKLVMGYCKAAGLDPLQKPVYIVPMDVKVGKDDDGKDVYSKRDVIMPGVGTYRTQASRTGLYAGMSEPVFGPTQKMPTKVKQWNNAHKGDRTFRIVDGPDMEFPTWCRITVRRLLGTLTVEFTALEYWLENYATAGNDTTAPNNMWKKRPFAQLAKCAEAQALRKAFPEVGAAPTADEMEGHDLRVETDVTPPKNNILPELTTWPDADFDKNLKAWGNVIGSGKKTHDELIAFASSRHTFAPEQLARINALPVYEIEGSES